METDSLCLELVEEDLHKCIREGKSKGGKCCEAKTLTVQVLAVIFSKLQFPRNTNNTTRENFDKSRRC